MTSPVVHLVCGLNGAGKSTVARQLEADGSVRLGLDEYMIARYAGLRYDDPEYAHHVTDAIEVLWSAAAEALGAGRSVVLDWNQWSRARRAVASGRARQLGAEPLLHRVDVPVQLAVERARDRRDPTSHLLDEAGVRHLATIFEAPSADEGIPIVRHAADQRDRHCH